MKSIEKEGYGRGGGRYRNEGKRRKGFKNDPTYS